MISSFLLLSCKSSVSVKIVLMEKKITCMVFLNKNLIIFMYVCCSYMLPKVDWIFYFGLTVNYLSFHYSLNRVRQITVEILRYKHICKAKNPWLVSKFSILCLFSTLLRFCFKHRSVYCLFCDTYCKEI